MDNLIEYFETENHNLDGSELSNSLNLSQKMAATNQYVSCIKFNGIPILPPVLTARRKDEMMSYKYQAQIAEKKIKAKERERLMARAERIVRNTQSSHHDVAKSDKQTTKNKPNICQKVEHIQTLAETEQFEEAIQTIDSLSSGLMSLEDGSLPKDFYGLPCTSVHEQQISQVLQKLSKQLNLKDTLSSTGGSEIIEDKSNLLSDKIVPDIGSEDSSYSFRDSQDTVVEVIRKQKPPAIRIELHNESMSVKDSPSCGYGSGDSTNTSASDRIKGSPKSLKNTVHFSEFVKVLNTNQSVEDNITVKRLEESKPANAQYLSNQKQKVIEKKEAPEISQKSDSLLSKVVLNPETEVESPSPDSMLEVPFLRNPELTPNTKQTIPEKQSNPQSRPDDCSTTASKPKSTHCDSDHNSDPGSATSEKRSSQVNRSSSVKCNKLRQLKKKETSQNTSIQSSLLSNQSTDNLTSSQTSNQSQISSTNTVSKTYKETVSFNPDTYSGNDTQSTLHTNDEKGTTSVSENTGHFSNVTDSQISAKSDFTLATTDSESTLKGDGHVGSSTGSSNLLRYRKAIENTLENSIVFSDNEVSKSQVHSIINSTDCEMNNFNGIQNVSTVGSKGKGHVRRGSYTLDNPSPVLIQAQSRIMQNGGGVLNSAGIGISLQRKLDYEDDLELENTRPLSLPIPPGQESDGKVEHIHRYLNQVQQAPAISLEEQPDKYSTINSVNLLHSLMEQINNKPNMSEDEMLTLQKAHFNSMHYQLIEQQRSDLEELFVHQRREQINLQSEIDTHHKQIKVSSKQGSVKKSKEICDSPSEINDNERNIKNSSLLSDSSVVYQNRRHRGVDKNTPNHLSFPKTSTPTPKVYRPLVRSPVKQEQVYRPRQPVRLPQNINDIETQLKFYKVTALAKGFLTRKLLHSEKVQELLKTIKDTREFAFSFQSETPIKNGTYSNQDRMLLERIIAQLQAALLDIHEVFFILPIPERMELIRQTRQKQHERKYLGTSSTLRDSTRKVSSATLKAIERKRKAQEDEASGTSRPNTAPPTTSSPRSHAVDMRALKPLQGQISPIISDGSNSNRPNTKERPKTAPEKITKEQMAAKNRKISNATPTTDKPNKTPTSNNKLTRIIRKISSKTDKAWR